MRTHPDQSLPDRLARLFESLKALVEEERPHEMALEDGFLGKNPRTALLIGQARGVAMVVAAQAGMKVCLYPPGEVKLALTGNGAATKEQVAFMVSRLLNLGSHRIPRDCTDALAVALCRCSRRLVEERLTP